MSIENNKTEKPNMEQYGWHNQESFDDLPSGWMVEDGEENYFKALKEWEDANRLF